MRRCTFLTMRTHERRARDWNGIFASITPSGHIRHSTIVVLVPGISTSGAMLGVAIFLAGGRAQRPWPGPLRPTTCPRGVSNVSPMMLGGIVRKTGLKIVLDIGSTL